MPTSRRNRMTGGLAALIGGLSMSLLGPAAPAHAEEPTLDEQLWCVMHPGDCAAMQDAAHWALRTASWRYPDSFANNGAGDAFRHCIWSGTLAQRTGHDTAYTAVMIHEYSDVNSGDELKMATATMDAFNDQVGLDVGDRADREGGSNTWGWIVDQCAGLADSHQLYGLNGVRGAY